jgi:hypothetical protein
VVRFGSGDQQAEHRPDDAEFVGGVLWFGLTYGGGEATQPSRSAPSWTAWSAGPAAAICSVLDEYLPGR